MVDTQAVIGRLAQVGAATLAGPRRVPDRGAHVAHRRGRRGQGRSPKEVPLMKRALQLHRDQRGLVGKMIDRLAAPGGRARHRCRRRGFDRAHEVQALERGRGSGERRGGCAPERIERGGGMSRGPEPGGGDAARSAARPQLLRSEPHDRSRSRSRFAPRQAPCSRAAWSSRSTTRSSSKERPTARPACSVDA